MAFNENQIQQLKLLLEVQSDGYNKLINVIREEYKELKNETTVKILELQQSLEFTQKENDELKKRGTPIKEFKE